MVLSHFSGVKCLCFGAVVPLLAISFGDNFAGGVSQPIPVSIGDDLVMEEAGTSAKIEAIAVDARFFHFNGSRCRAARSNGTSFNC